MVRFFKRQTEDGDLSRAQRRVRMLSDRDVVLWGDSLITQAGQLLRDYQRDLSPVALEEFRLATEALTAMAEELQRRHE